MQFQITVHLINLKSLTISRLIMKAVWETHIQNQIYNIVNSVHSVCIYKYICKYNVQCTSVHLVHLGYWVHKNIEIKMMWNIER